MVICLLHIERSGGTTLHYILRSNFLSFMTLTPWKYWTNKEENSFSPQEAGILFRVLPFTKGFGGHLTRSYLGYEKAIGKRVRYITFLREPLSRFFSHFRYQRDVMGIDRDIKAFLDEDQFSNFMTKRIAGSEDLEKAKCALLDEYSFVGLMERFDESLVLMKDQLNLPNLDIRYQRKNANPSLNQDARTVADDVQKRIMERNALDIELYKFAKEHIFAKYINEFGADFNKCLAEFRIQNRDFKFSWWRRLCWVTYRFVVYRNIEYIVHLLCHRR